MTPRESTAIVLSLGLLVSAAALRIPRDVEPSPSTDPRWLDVPVQQAFEALRTHEDEREARFVEALDPAAFDVEREKNLARAHTSADASALATIGRDLFLRDFAGDDSPRARSATRCASCHHRGGPGGAGGLIDDFLKKRNPPSLIGAVAIERAAAAITVELKKLGQRDAALVVGGVSFGTRGAPKGVAADLVVRPFGRTGRWATVRDAIRDIAPETMGTALLPAEIAALTAFVGTLPEPSLVPPDASRTPDLYRAYARGRNRFEKIGCGSCHVPELRLPDGSVLSAFTDFRRHDLGPEMADGATREWFTAPLWTVGTSAPWLHDGRALASLDLAILAHGGEAAASRDRYAALLPTERGEIKTLLLSLTPEPKMQVAGR